MMKPPSLRHAVFVFAALVLGASACGDDDTAADDTTSTTDVEVTTTTSTPPSSTTTAPQTTSAEATGPVDDADLPGEPFDIGPGEGAVVSVVGVASDDVLNVRRLPDVTSDILDELDPLTDDVELTGRKRLLTTSAWWEIDLGDDVGWANSAFLAPTAATNDITSQLLADMGGAVTADSVDGVIDQVIDHFTQGVDEPVPDVVVSSAPSDGDLIEGTVDVTGYPDDSVLGERLHLFIAEENATFGLRTVESTTLCRRGSDGELCV